MRRAIRPYRSSSDLVRALSDPPPPPPEAGGPVPHVPKWYTRVALTAAVVLISAVVALQFEEIPVTASGGVATAAAVVTLLASGRYARLERRRSEQLDASSAALRDQAHGVLDRDWLTGLMTANEFWQVLRREINRSRRYQRECSVLVADVDLDAFLASSHHAENADPNHLSRHLADMVKASVRESDAIARRSGAFGVKILLPETPGSRAEVVAVRVQNKLKENPITLLDGRQVPLLLNTVVVSYPGDGESVANLASALSRRTVVRRESLASAV